MKRIVVAVLILTLLLTSISFANSTELSAVISNIKLFVNEIKVDKEVVVIDGTSYLPVRAISEVLGLELDWNGETRTISLAGGNNNEELQGLRAENARLKEELEALKEQNSQSEPDVGIPSFDDAAISFSDRAYKVNRDKLAEELKEFDNISVVTNGMGPWYNGNIKSELDWIREHGADPYDDSKGYRSTANPTSDYILVVLSKGNEPLAYCVYGLK